MVRAAPNCKLYISGWCTVDDHVTNRPVWASADAHETALGQTSAHHGCKKHRVASPASVAAASLLLGAVRASSSISWAHWRHNGLVVQGTAGGVGHLVRQHFTETDIGCGVEDAAYG